MTAVGASLPLEGIPESPITIATVCGDDGVVASLHDRTSWQLATEMAKPGPTWAINILRYRFLDVEKLSINA